jgi:signal peptidase I
MNDLAPIFRRVAAINPVPDESDLPTGAMSTTALLDVIDERTEPMRTQQVEAKPTNEPNRRRTGALVAAAAFTVVIAVGSIIALVNSQTVDSSSEAAAGSVSIVSADDVVSRNTFNSMENAIHPGALLTVDRSAYDSKHPERFDIVLYADTRVSDVDAPAEMVTRVIGLPGETIEARDGRVYINDRILEEPYLKSPELPMPPFGPITLNADELWLMGDNRPASGDSRFRGAIAVSLLRGQITEIANP